jgi:hypothetical protein
MSRVLGGSAWVKCYIKHCGERATHGHGTVHEGVHLQWLLSDCLGGEFAGEEKGVFGYLLELGGHGGVVWAMSVTCCREGCERSHLAAYMKLMTAAAAADDDDDDDDNSGCDE